MYPNEDSQPPQTAPPVPAYQPPSASPSSPATPEQPTGDDPGKTLAIVGIVLAFFFSVVGLILSLIAKSKSRKAGYPTTLATVGIVLNSVFILLGIIMLGILTAITIAGFKSVQERAEATQRTTETQQLKYDSSSVALSVIKKAEVYYSLHNMYPTSLAQFDTSPETTLSQGELAAMSSIPVTDKIAIYTCENGGMATEYWDPSLALQRQYTTRDTIFNAQTCRIIE
ncbi:DUF4190 domain-containing protein [Candidatus Saccharibacteria bacterium]|nr:DUF4190 domain-containing protein [Candidatus Saccharibacteria bacterium]